MSITIAEASIEERIRRYPEDGEFTDPGDVVARAPDGLDLVVEHRRQHLELRALIHEGLDRAVRGVVIPRTPELMDETWAEAVEADRRGDPTPDQVEPWARARDRTAEGPRRHRPALGRAVGRRANAAVSSEAPCRVRQPRRLPGSRSAAAA